MPKSAASQQEDDHMGLQLGTLTPKLFYSLPYGAPESKAFPLALHSDVGKNAQVTSYQHYRNTW